MDKKNKKKEKPIQQESQQPSLALQIVNRYFRWLLTLVIVIAILVAYMTVIDTQITKVRDVARNSLTAKEQTLAALKEIKTDVDAVVQDYGALVERKKSELDLLNNMLPSVSKYGDIYTIVDQVTTRSGLTLSNITLAFEGAGESELHSGAAAGPPNISATAKKMTLHVSVDGGNYDTLKKYLENLERSIPLFDVQSLSFDSGAFIPDEKGETPIPHYDIELATYYQP